MVKIMKKFVFFLLISIPIAVQAKIFSKETFQTANGKWSIGILGGGLGIFENKGRGVFGMNLTIKGVYVDVLGKGSTHTSDVEVKKWSESSGTAFHAGYQFPVTKSFRIIPIAGYYTLGRTTTDGYNWTVSKSGISNKTSTSIESRGFDYGGILVFNTKHVNFYGACSKHTLYGGIAYQF